MHILRWVRILLTLCGCMQPPSWSSPLKRHLYNVYTIFVLAMVCTFMLTQILDAVLVVDNLDDFYDNIFVMLVVMVASYKIFYFLLNRETYAILIDALNKEPFLPTNEEEDEIRARFDRLSECNAIGYTILIQSCILFLWVSTLLKDYKNRKLAFRAWMPYDYCPMLLFALTFLYQVVAATFGALVNCAFDNLFNCLLIHTSGQLELLGHRLNRIAGNELQSAQQCVHHHESIYKFATMVNSDFKSILGVQFLASFLTICFSLYRLTQKEFGVKFIETFFYVICLIMEILYYCWYGNEVKLKSLELSGVIFRTKWTSLSVDTKRMLLMIMRRASMPIEYTSAYIVSMDLASFMSLIKTSYSAYNMLKTTKD